MKDVLRQLAAVACAVALPACPFAWSQDIAVDRLEALGAALQREAVWRADFVQDFTPVGMTQGDHAAGRVWLAWPDRALFHTGAPPYRLMGFKGRTVRLVDLEAGSCDEHALTDREWERVPLAAVLDPKNAQAHFTVGEHGETGVVLVPKEPGGVDRVEVLLGTKGLPAEVVIRDPQGAVNRLRFSGWTAADRPPEDAWLPAPPDGIECVTDPGAME